MPGAVSRLQQRVRKGRNDGNPYNGHGTERRKRDGRIGRSISPTSLGRGAGCAGRGGAGGGARSSHAAFVPSRERPDPIEVLEHQAAAGVPELVPIRYGRMLVSPFTFYRGEAMIMAGDLAATPRSGLTVQCCGDAHLSNFGMFASPERRLVFDLNDFDETLPGPWEWDVKRLAASMLIAAINNGNAVTDQERIALETVEGYRAAMQRFAGMTKLDVWYARMDAETVLQDLGAQIKPAMAKRTKDTIAKARTRDGMSAFSKLTERWTGGFGSSIRRRGSCRWTD